MSTSLTPVDWLSPEMFANPFPTYAKMREAAPIYPVAPVQLGAVTRYEDVVAVLKNPAVFSSAASRPVFEPDWLGQNALAHSMVVMDPPEHTQNRALISRAFTPAMVAHMEPQVRQLAQSIVDAWQKAGEVDVVKEVTTRLAVTVIAQLMGLDIKMEETFSYWADVEATLQQVPPDENYVAKTRQALQEMESFLKGVLAERRRKPGEDLVSLLVRAEAEGSVLPEREFVGFLALLLVAGFETSANLIAKAIHLLGEQPQLSAALHQDQTLIPKFIEEMLRYDGPVHTIFRTAMQDAELSGVSLKAGTPLMLVTAAANRDPKQFPDPDRFDYNRNNLHTVAFGHGIHFCLGAPLARLETRVLLETLLSRGQGFEITQPMVRKRGLSMHGVQHLFARLIPA